MIHERLNDIKVHRYLKGDGLNKGATEEDVLPIAQADETLGPKRLLEAVAGKREKIQHAIDHEPKHSPGALAQDIVFLMGMNYMAKWLLALPSNAKRILKITDGEDRQ